MVSPPCCAGHAVWLYQGESLTHLPVHHEQFNRIMIKLSSVDNARYGNMLVFQSGNTRLGPDSKQTAVRKTLG